MSRKLTTEEFIIGAVKVHGNKYDYSLVDYIDDKTKVLIRCKIHGLFKQEPSGHKCGTGCPQCGYEARGRLKTSRAAETFIRDCTIIHNSKYSYEDAIYVNSKTPIKITCPTHGSFQQVPNSHKSGNGCPTCAFEITSVSRRLYVASSTTTNLYYVYFPEYNLWKIGCTARDIEKRFAADKIVMKIMAIKTYEDSCMAYFVESWILKATHSNRTKVKILIGGNSELRIAPIVNIIDLVKEAESWYPN